jgi:hypothetical protein
MKVDHWRVPVLTGFGLAFQILAIRIEGGRKLDAIA